MSSYKYLFALAIPLALSSCKVTKTYETPSLSQQIQDSLYRDHYVQDTANMATLSWKTVFQDAALQSLIEKGLANNLDIQNAVENIVQAEALLKRSKLAFLPSLNINPTVTFNKTSVRSLNFNSQVSSMMRLKTTSYQIPLTTSWELDVWGKLASSRRAQYASYLNTIEARKALNTSIIRSIANNYYQLLALDKQLRITRETVVLREKSVKTMKALMEAGIITGAAVVQSEANLAAAKVSIPDLENSIRQVENAICTLLGTPGQSITRGTLDAQAVYSGLEVGVPAQLLQYRPDVVAAELKLRQMFELTNVARTAFYPQIGLNSGTFGVSSIDLQHLFDKSIFYSFAAGIVQPIFSKGVNKANLEVAKSQQCQAYLAFRKTLLTAGQEVSNAMNNYQTATAKATSRQEQITALTKAVEYTNKLLQYSSSTNYTDVLTSEQSLLSAQLSEVNDQLQKLQAVVDLYAALGGGATME